MSQIDPTSPFGINNIRRFIAFRIFFNARFYYPVFTILFLDFGLTLRQFALLNAVWAATIVLLEVPSGALADIFGRRKLLICTGILMVVEMSLLCFVPLGNLNLLFWVFLVNRILSGAAEALASGADEALAYDTLKRERQPENWGQVLAAQMRLASVARIAIMLLGAAVYDPNLMQQVAGRLGVPITFTQETTLRFPIYLTLMMAFMTLWTSIQMNEIPRTPGAHLSGKSIYLAFTVTFRAGKWILRTPFALVIILMGLFFDGILRSMTTMRSQYYRLIDLPVSSFGVIGSGVALLGVFIPRLALRMVNRNSPMFNLWVMAGLTFFGFIGVSFFFPIIGLVPIFLLAGSGYLLRFFISHYLNRITESDQRATVLSFKGLSFNLAYGFFGVLYAFLLTFLRSQVVETQPGLPADIVENVVFIESIGWFPWVFLVGFTTLLVFAWRWLGKTKV